MDKAEYKRVTCVALLVDTVFPLGLIRNGAVLSIVLPYCGHMSFLRVDLVSMMQCGLKDNFVQGTDILRDFKCWTFLNLAYQHIVHWVRVPLFLSEQRFCHSQCGLVRATTGWRSRNPRQPGPGGESCSLQSRLPKFLSWRARIQHALWIFWFKHTYLTL